MTSDGFSTARLALVLAQLPLSPNPPQNPLSIYPYMMTTLEIKSPGMQGLERGNMRCLKHHLPSLYTGVNIYIFLIEGILNKY